MSRIFRFFLWVLGMLLLLIVIAFFLPRNIIVERSIFIDASPKIVFSQVNDLYNWNYWSIWSKVDPGMEIIYAGKGVGVSSGFEWESENKKVGSGSLNILESEKYDSIVFSIHFMKGGPVKSVITFRENGMGTNVNWSFLYDTNNNPFLRWRGLFMKKSVGPDIEEGLTNLDAHCKVLEEEGAYIVEMDELKEFRYAGIREKVSFNEISVKIGEMFGSITAYLEAKNIRISGVPFAIYHLMDGQEIDLECGIPVTEEFIGTDKIVSGIWPSTKCATVDYVGDYYQLELAHDAIQQWITKHKFVLSGAPVEMYLTDTESEPDPENWLTRIYYPVE